MRPIWTIARVVILLAALATTFVTILFVSGPGGTSIDPNGAIVDAIALIVIVAVAWSLWRDRASLM
jgi:hypothetical protein